MVRDEETERADAAALAESERRYRLLAENSTDVISVVDRTGILQYVSPACRVLVGYEPEELIGRSGSEFIHPEDLPRVTEAHATALDRPDSIASPPYRIRRKDGSYVWIESTVRPIPDPETGEIVEVQSSARDVSERVRAAQELRLERELAFAIGEAESLEAALGLTLQKTCETTGWALGQAWVRPEAGAGLVLGSAWHAASDGLEAFKEKSESIIFVPGSGLPGRAWKAGKPVLVTDIGSDPSFLRAAAATAAGLQSAIAVPVLAKDEVVVVLEFFVFEPREEDERLIDLVAAVAAQLGSLVRRKQAEEGMERAHAELETLHAELGRRTAELERSNLELEQFAYDASHDLGEPLRIVSRLALRLTEQYGDRIEREGRVLVDSIVEGAERMQMLISDLLEYSRVAREPLDRAHVDCAQVLNEALDLLAESIAEKNASVTADPLPSIEAHPTQFRQLLQNLLSNALKFSGDAPLRVHVGAERKQGAWEFSVSDNGIGVDPGQSERIFELFRRLGPRDLYAGTGIGLSICKRIVDRHGGRIWVEPASGGGSVFRFTIPASPIDPLSQ